MSSWTGCIEPRRQNLSKCQRRKGKSHAYWLGVKPSAWISVALAFRNEDNEARWQFGQTDSASENSPIIVLASDRKTVPTSAQTSTTWLHSGQAEKHSSPWPSQQGQRGSTRYHIGGTICIRFGFVHACRWSLQTPLWDVSAVDDFLPVSLGVRASARNTAARSHHRHVIRVASQQLFPSRRIPHLAPELFDLLWSSGV